MDIGGRKKMKARIRRAAALFSLLVLLIPLYAGADENKPRTTRPPLVTEPPVSEPETPERDAEGFLVSEGEFIWEDDEGGLWMYLSGTLQVVIRRLQDKSIPLIWFETEVRTRGEERFRTVMTNPDHPARTYKFPYKIAQEEGFVLGFTDDFYADRMKNNQTVGIIIREGRIISDKTNRKRNSHLPNLDMMIQYPDDRLEVCGCTEYTAEELLEKGALNVFSFGPILIRDGELNEQALNKYGTSHAQRTAVGMVEKGHYFFMMLEGRIKRSKGDGISFLAEKLLEKGCTLGFNLDGGDTSCIVFMGHQLCKMTNGKRNLSSRRTSDILGVGTSELLPAVSDPW